jgi:hypothetical protein
MEAASDARTARAKHHGPASGMTMIVRGGTPERVNHAIRPMTMIVRGGTPERVDHVISPMIQPDQA